MPARTSKIITVLTLVLAGCGGGANDGQVTTPEPQTGSQNQGTTAPDDDSDQSRAGTTVAAGGSQLPLSAANVASLTLDGETYAFRVLENGKCFSSFYGSFAVGGELVDEAGDRIEPELVDGIRGLQHGISIEMATDGDLAESQVIAFLDKNWYAAPDILVGPDTNLSGNVDTFTIDGTHVEGSATFYSSDGDGPVTGTFEATCQE